jgi:hypothetical protein
MFLDIHHLFISWILIDLDIKKIKIYFPIMLGANFLWVEKSPKGNILFLKGNILSQIFLSQKIKKFIN